MKQLPMVTKDTRHAATRGIQVTKGSAPKAVYKEASTAINEVDLASSQRLAMVQQMRDRDDDDKSEDEEAVDTFAADAFEVQQDPHEPHFLITIGRSSWETKI
jgi:flagellum-specific peptidoglycan hydrolase FlgJ